MTHLLSAATNGRAPLYVSLCSARVFVKLMEELTTEAPCYKYQQQTRTRKNGFKEDIISYEWIQADSIMMPPLDGDFNWIFKNYRAEGKIYRARCNSIEFVYFSNSQMLRADISYDVYQWLGPLNSMKSSTSNKLKS